MQPAPDSSSADFTADSPRLEAGSPQPLGANWTGRGTNFAVLSANATRVELCLFDATQGHALQRNLLVGLRTRSVNHGRWPASAHHLERSFF
jgi:glycogen operon protein